MRNHQEQRFCLKNELSQSSSQLSREEQERVDSSIHFEKALESYLSEENASNQGQV